MTDCVLTLNAGSSSVKYALYACRAELEQPLLGGSVELQDAAGALTTHAATLQEVLDAVRAAPHQDLRVVAVGHRVVHGGTRFAQPALVDDAVEAAIEALVPLAPLHQPHNLAGVRAARAAFPGVPQVACFDTAFHRTMPDVQQRFALPAAWHDAGIRRYGFHGLSYQSVQAQLSRLDPALARGRVVVAHLGNGASMCALQDGRSAATTMSFSPLDGLTMGTRCGRLDAAVVLHLMRRHGLDADAVEQLLHRQSGLLGLSGLSADMRTLLASDAPAARLAIDHFVESVLHGLGALTAALRGLDGFVLTGGIGENAAVLRQRIVEGAAWLGLTLNPEANARQQPGRISAPGSVPSVWLIHTDEEAVIAQHTMRLTPVPHAEASPSS